MFKRIKNLIALSNAPQVAIDNAVKAMQENSEKIGDGKAVFISEGLQKDYEEQILEDKGMKGIFGLTK